MTTQITLRLPKGLWADLEETIIQQDRQFLTEVARSLGLPVPEVLRRVLGTGAPQPLPVLWTPPTATADDPTACPWWECHGALWRRCPRTRLSPTMPCPVHERSTPCPFTRLDSDPVIRALPWRTPVMSRGHLYWIDPTGEALPLTEDGRPDTTCSFRWIHHRGKRILARVPVAET
jgi:hypothetical protein